MKPGLFGTMVPSSWSLRSLGELVQEGSDSAIPSETPNRPYIGMEHIESGTGRVIALASPNEYRSSSYVAKPNQVLYGRLRPYLNKVFIPNREVYASREFIPLTPGESLNSHYLLYLLRSSEFVNYAMSLNSGDRPRVKWQQMESCLIPAPPSDEQDEIVRILEEQFSRLDAAAASIAAVRRKADQFRRSLIESCIFGHLSEHFADAWEFKSLDELVDKKSDIVDGPFGSNLKSEHYVASGARVIRLQNIGYGDFRDDAAFISLERFGLLQKHSVQAGDLLFASLGENLPRTCLVPQLDTPAIVKADCIRVRLSTTVCSRYVLMATQSPTARTWAAEQLHGLGRPRLGLGNIRQFPVRIPPIGAQHRIVDFLDSQLEGVVRLEEESVGFLNHISGLRKAILHAAFNGELTKEWRGKNNG